ncbi:MAG: serine dehydratase beta chain [Pseudomonadales bacterium]
MIASVSDLSEIGIDSSRTQTVGPMRAAYVFATELSHSGVLEHVARVGVELFGSLGLSGHRHGTDKAVLLGLSGEEPERVDPNAAADLVSDVIDGGVLSLLQLHDLPFEAQRDVVFHQRQSLPGHTNGMRFRAFNEDGEAVHQRVYYSTGGGTIVEEAFLQES